MPLVFVITVDDVLPPSNALAPLAGDVNVTDAPLTGLAEASFTRACSVEKPVFKVVLCGVPADAVTLLGGPAATKNFKPTGACGAPPPDVPPLFVRLKIAEPATPATVAVTL